MYRVACVYRGICIEHFNHSAYPRACARRTFFNAPRNADADGSACEDDDYDDDDDEDDDDRFR